MKNKAGSLNTLKMLEQYIPIVDRVHGATHLEFHDVRRVFEDINHKVKKEGVDKTQLDKEFQQLRKITNNYKVPNDVCESYEAVYNMLEDIDKAYNS